MTRRCGGRMGEIFCRARYCVPFSIVIVAVHFALWWYVIYPRLISTKDPLLENDFKTGYGPGYSDRAYLSNEDPEESYGTSRELESTTSTTPSEEASSVSSFETTSHEFGIPTSSVENLRQEFGTQAREIQRPQHQHRHRHHYNRHGSRYQIRRKRPLSHVYTTPSPTPTAAQRRILENVSTRRQPPPPQTSVWSTRAWPTQPPWSPTSPATTVNPTTLLTNLIVQVTTRHRTPHQHRQHHGRHHHTTTTTTPAPVTPQFRHHHHFERERNEELQRQREQIEREKERREQERMRLLVEERAKQRMQGEDTPRLPEDLERRAQAIYEAQQRSLKQMKEEKLRLQVVQEEEARRREEHERRLQGWNREDERRQPQGHVPPLHESNQWHHPRVEPQQRPETVNIPQPTPQQRLQSSEVVADPWAHLRQVQEQRSTSYTVAPATRSPGISNEIDPFSITRHSLEEASGVWRGHVDHQNAHINAIDHQRHHQHQQVDSQQRHHHRQHHHGHEQQGQQQPEPQRPQPRIEAPQRPSEADARRQMIEDEERRKEEYERRLQQWQRENQARQTPTTTTSPPEPEIPNVPESLHPQQHHHHSILGLPHQTHHHGHLQVPTQSRENEISNEIAPPPEVSRHKRDAAPVIVTGLLDIGRSEWFQFTRLYSTYLENLMDLLKLQNRFIIFGDQQVLDHLKNHSDTVDFSRIQFVHFGLDDLSFSRYRDEIKGIMDDEQKNWQDKWERAMKTHPESINPDYNILTNSKPYLLYNATQISKFESDYFIWLDAGYSHGDKNLIPPILWNPVLPPGKLTVIKLTPKQDKVTNYQIEHIYRKNWPVMSGGLLAGDKVTIDRFRRYFYKTFMDLLEARKTDDDQTTLLMTVVNYHSMFNILNGGWFDAFKLLPNQ